VSTAIAKIHNAEGDILRRKIRVHELISASLVTEDDKENNMLELMAMTKLSQPVESKFALRHQRKILWIFKIFICVYNRAFSSEAPYAV